MSKLEVLEDAADGTEKKLQWTRKDILMAILFLMFGVGTWLNLNGIWVELPLLIPKLPEGWSLSPVLGMACNIANVGPAIIAIIRALIGKSSAYEVPSISIIFAVGIFVPVILSFTWNKQVYAFEANRSVYMIVLSFFLALVNCTSSVTYLPFVNHFDKKWLNVYFAGEALSNLIPAMLGLIQGVGEQMICTPDQANLTSRENLTSQANLTEQITKSTSARFSVETYFICLSVIMFISFIAFICLWRTKKNIKEEKTAAEKVITGENAQSSLLAYTSEQVSVKDEKNKQEQFTRQGVVYLGIILWTSILLIGCIPSINSYSLNPYGAATFHYVIIICQCCYPLVSLLASLFPKYFEISPVGIAISTVAGTVAFAYAYIAAHLSPCAPFVDTSYGKYLIAGVWAFVYLIFYYERIIIGNYLNKTSGHRGLFWYGQLTQIGAFIGALYIFVLTTLNVFKERDFCKSYQC